MLERGCVSGARRVRDAAGRGVTMGWRIGLETRRRGGSETRRRSVEMVWRLALRGAERGSVATVGRLPLRGGEV